MGKNAKGQWMPGYSGNPLGRPRKKPKVPKGLAEEAAAVLLKTLTITEGGERREISYLEAMLSKTAHGAIKGSVKDLLLTLEKFAKFGAFDVLAAQAAAAEEGLIFTAADIKLIEEIEKTMDLDDDDA